MPSYKLTYFNNRGRAEVSRLMFAAANQPYEDVRLNEEQWAKLKPTTPFGHLPILDCDGVVLAESNAIARLLAKRFGFAGKTDIDQAKCDMIVDSTEDFAIEMIKIFFVEKDSAKKEELKTTFYDEKCPPFLKNMEKSLKSNKGGDGYFAGDSLTWADIHFCFWISWQGEVDLTPYPKLKALKARVEAEPGIAKWIKERPDTPY